MSDNLASEYGRITRYLSKNRIQGSGSGEDEPPHDDDASTSSSKRMRLDTLPPKVLVDIICGVDHDDLEQLYLVSKTIKEAALKAKDVHFQYLQVKFYSKEENFT